MNAVWTWLPWFLVFDAIVVVLVVILWGIRREKKRTEAMHQIADQLGLQFFPTGDPTLISALGEFHLFSQGRSKQITNMIHGESENVDVGIFDYQYTTGGGDDAHTWRQTVICFQSADLNLPQFALRPETLFDKIGSVFGVHDIDFDTHPEFSKIYLLRGSDEQRIREVFHKEVLSFIEAKVGVNLEANGSRLIYFRPGKRIYPSEVRSFMEEGFKVYGLMRSSTQDRGREV
jgi:hypothetical protein